MRYSFISAAILAISSSAFAQDATAGFDVISIPSNYQAVNAGETVAITWDATSAISAAVDTVEIYLLQGASQTTLQIATDAVASGLQNSLGTFSWTAPSASYALYGFKIASTSNSSLFQYSYPFTITGSISSASSSASSAAVTTTVSLASNTAYTSTSTSTISSSSTSVSTFSPAITPVVAAVASVNTTTAASNATTLTSVKASSTGSKTATGSNSTVTGAPLATVTSNPAASNFANGGLAVIGAALIAFAL